MIIRMKKRIRSENGIKRSSFMAVFFKLKNNFSFSNIFICIIICVRYTGTFLKNFSEKKYLWRIYSLSLGLKSKLRLMVHNVHHLSLLTFLLITFQFLIQAFIFFIIFRERERDRKKVRRSISFPLIRTQIRF